MTEQFTLQDPGEGIHEAEIKEIHVAEGDQVTDGDIILTVETDKAAIDVPAPFSGVVQEIRFGVGDIAEVGDVIMTYGGDAKETKSRETKTKETKKRGKEKTKGSTEEEKDNEKVESAEPQEDVEGASEPKTKAPRKQGPVPASPATRRLARDLGVDLRAVDASGPGGRVTADDVHAAAEAGPDDHSKQESKAKEPPNEKKARPEPTALPDFSQWGATERVPLRSIRRTTARRMARSWAQIPHVMHEDEADITGLEHWRQDHKETIEKQGGKLTLTVLMMKALVAALKEFPRFNASLDAEDDAIVLKHHFHIGVAVDTDEGLMVPVVRDVDRKSIVELAAELPSLADKARAGKLSRDDMRGATFTITNPGPIGGRVMTPIIDFPQVAILGLGQARLEPRVDGDLETFEIVPRLILPVCLAFDHRVNDGADAGRFVNKLIATVSDTEAILLNT